MNLQELIGAKNYSRNSLTQSQICSTIVLQRKEMIFMSYSIRMTKEEKDIAENYAKINNISLAEAFKRALFDRIEDEYDMKVFDEYEEEKAKGNVKTYSHEEVWKELGL